AAGLSWIFFDSIRGRKPSAMGFCIGAVVGMVAITLASGFVGIPQSLCIGVVAALISNLAVHWRSQSSLDDTLDVFPCHGIGGMVGMLLTGVFATTAINPDGANGWLYGNFSLFSTQLLGMLIVASYSFVMAWILFKIVNLIYPIRVSEDEEELGLDISQHDESNNIQGGYPILDI
ncbi:MAG TPA: hypothetical protein VK084_11305, partial [Chitinophagaceae bacterium]|nr:hypothetical protein [Chitinophagaceae bacterium]